VGIVLVKICGNRSPEEVGYAEGADAVGAVVESPDSARNLPHDRARDVLAAAPEGTGAVAVTVAREPDRLGRIAEAVEPDVLQLHAGAEAATLADLARSHPRLALWIGTDPQEGVPDVPIGEDGPVDAVVVDARTADGYGGTGRAPDWEEARALRERLHPVPTILAGGLRPDNVAQAIEAVGPAGVDVASGVETDGRKDPDHVRDFIARARDAEVSP
jgi:phosphoribosylanthranilate isomerase